MDRRLGLGKGVQQAGNRFGRSGLQRSRIRILRRARQQPSGQRTQRLQVMAGHQTSL